MRPLNLCRVAWMDEAHGIAALLRGAVNGGRATSHCNADASTFLARDAYDCSWRSWCSLIHQSDRSVAVRPTYRSMLQRLLNGCNSATLDLSRGEQVLLIHGARPQETQLRNSSQYRRNRIGLLFGIHTPRRQKRSPAMAAPAWPEPSASDQP